MTVDKLIPEKEIVMTCHGDQAEWKGTTLKWTFAADGNQTSLRFIHGGWKSMTDYCASCNAMRGQLLFRLKNYVEGRNPGPQWTR